MTSIDITLKQKSNKDIDNYRIAVPFIGTTELHLENINVIKNLLLGYDSNEWLLAANENLLKKMMSWKDKKND